MINIVCSDEKLIPTRATEGSGGYDLYLSGDTAIAPNRSIIVGTGVKMKIPAGHIGLITPRSSTESKGFCLANTVGVIDEDYRGEIMLKIKNITAHKALVYKYDKLFQISIIPILQQPLNLVEELDSTDRGEGGFGSTDKH